MVTRTRRGPCHRVCPYYMSRDNLSRADVIFAPYNYLVDPATRKAQGIDISNSVIIFDEAHNLESSFGDVASFELTGQDLALCLAELDKCAIILENSPVIVGAELTLDDVVRLKSMPYGCDCGSAWLLWLTSRCFDRFGPAHD